MPADPRRDIEVVRQELAGVPAMIPAVLDDLWPRVQDLLPQLPRPITRVVLTGCGDSLFAGMAARWAFERFAGVPAEALEALDLARYYADTLPPGTLVLPISYSGQVARTVEAAHNARHFGATVAAITGRPERRLGQTAPYVLPVTVPSLGFSLGTSTYIGLLLAAYALAIGIGRQRSVLDEARAAALLDALRTVGPACVPLVEAPDTAMREHAAFLAESESVVFLGAGPNQSSAHFGAAKLFEGAQMNGIAQNTEEWAHAQYFISGPYTRTVLLAPRGRSLDRAHEIGREMRFIGAPFLAITDDDPARWRELTPRVIALPAGTPEVFSPLLFAVPLSQLGYHLAALRGKGSYNFAGEEHEREHYQTLHESAFRDLTRNTDGPP